MNSVTVLVKLFDDFQRLRIASQLRAKNLKVKLSKEDKKLVGLISIKLKEYEKKTFSRIKYNVEKQRIYSEFLKDIKGIGPTMAGVIISEFDITKADTISDFWSFAGLGVVNGKAPKPKEGEKLPYNAWLRAKLVGVLADCFIKSKSPYTIFYYNYKQRKQSEGWGKNDKHRHLASKRYMIKMFLKDLWIYWRGIENLPIRPSYQEEYLNHEHKEIIPSV